MGRPPAPPGLHYGDNSRYFMLFHYVKREPTIRSPFEAAQQTTGNPMFMAPSSIRLCPTSRSGRRSTCGAWALGRGSLGLGSPDDTTSFVTPGEMVDTNNVLHTTENTPFIQFQWVAGGGTLPPSGRRSGVRS